MRCQFDVLTVPSSDTSRLPCIVLSYDDRKYLFNCGEGTQRQLISRKVPIKKIRHIFTSFGWESHGGLAGLLLNMTSSSPSFKLGLHGPRNLSYYLATLRAGQQRITRFLDVPDLQIDEYQTALPPAFVDENLTIQPILATPSLRLSDSSPTTPTAPHSSSTDVFASRVVLDHARVQNIAHSVWSGQFLTRQKDGSWKAPMVSSTTTTTKSPHIKESGLKRSFPAGEVLTSSNKRTKKSESDYDSISGSSKPSVAQIRSFNRYMMDDLPDGFKPFPAAISYYIQGHPLPGKFDPTRAKELGIPPGPDFGRLQRGANITLSDGRFIRSCDVMGPSRISPPVAIIHCPSIDYIDNLCQLEFWKDCHTDRALSVVIHTCGPGVFEDARYIAFMAKFGSNTKHFLNRDDYVEDKITNKKAAALIERLHPLAPEKYPMQTCQARYGTMPVQDFEESAINASPLEATLRFTPFPYLHMTKAEDIGDAKFPAEAQAIKQRFIESLNTLRVKLAILSARKRADFVGSEVELCTLGTGSAGPASYRNVSGTLLSVSDSFSILLDCGEGTLGQIKRTYGARYSEVLQGLQLVFISHLHADHHLGMIGLIREWQTCNSRNNKKLYIVCPDKYSRSIIEYHNIENIGITRIAFMNSHAFHEDSWRMNENTSLPAQLRELKQALPQVACVSTCPAIHSELAMSIRIDLVAGWSIAFSGDTRPNARFAVMAKDVTCLVHEATFEDGKLDEAVSKKHSTVSEALQIAKDANARFTILTHFSQRYPTLPPLADFRESHLTDSSVGFAIDTMRVKLKDIWQLGYHLKAQIEYEKELKRLDLTDLGSEEAQILLDD